MNWKFWKKNNEETADHAPVMVPSSTLFRWALYDLGIENPNKFAEAAGFTPISEEVEFMELQESNKRLSALDPYKSFISMMANITAEILTETSANLLGKEMFENTGIPQDVQEDLLFDMYLKISAMSLLPAVSAALDLGIMVNPGAYTTDRDSNEYF